MSDESQTIRLPKFSGNQEDWHDWSTKIVKQLDIKGLHRVFNRRFGKLADGTTDVTIPSEDDYWDLDESDEDENKQIKAFDMNKKAHAYLTICCTGTPLNIVKGAVTEDLPNGDALLAMERLKDKYEPKGVLAQVELTSKFSKCLLEGYSDPDDWFMALAELRRRMKDLKIPVSKEQYMSHILANLTQDYRSLFPVVAKTMEKDPDYDVEEMHNDIRGYYMKEIEPTKKVEQQALNTSQSTPYNSNQGNANNNGQFTEDQKAQFRDKEREKFRQGIIKYDPGPYVAEKCPHCGMWGHLEAYCINKKMGRAPGDRGPKKNFKKGKSKGPNQAHVAEQGHSDSFTMVFTSASGLNLKEMKTKWVADTGATTHMTNSKEGLFELKSLPDKEALVKMGNNSTMKAQCSGSLMVKVKTTEGKEVPIKLTNVLFIPDLMTNLFSLSVLMEKCPESLMNKSCFRVIKDGVKCMDIPLQKTPNSPLLFVDLKVQNDQALLTFPAGSKVQIMVAHQLLGHACEKVTRATAKALGWVLTGKFSVCDSCCEAKARQKDIGPAPAEQSKVPGERIFMDISGCDHTSAGGSKYWGMCVDDCSKFKWSFFLKKKSDLPAMMISFVKQLRAKGFPIKTIRMDNAGENLDFKAQAEAAEDKYKDKECLNIDFEITPRHTPQHNGVIERAFATVWNKTRALMAQAGLEDNLKYKLWTEATMTATLLENILVNKGEDSSWKLFYGPNKELPSYSKHLRPWGEVGWVALTNTHPPKLQERGVKCIMVGYTQEHSQGTYRMYNLSTRGIMTSRDVTWTGKFLSDKEAPPRIEPTEEPIVLEEGEEEENVQPPAQPVPQGNPPGAQVPPAPDPAPAQHPSGYQLRSKGAAEQIKLGPSGKPESYLANMANQIRDNMADKAQVVPEGQEALYGNYAFITGANPRGYKEAMASSARAQWIQGMEEEFKNIEDKKVWTPRKLEDVPHGMRPIGTRWVFVHKDDGRYRARLVVLGYNQVPGVDWKESFSPVVNDGTMRICFVLQAKHLKDEDWVAVHIDVQTAFLNGDLDEPIYLKIPDGYKMPEGYDVLELHKALYGLVQAARQWYKTLSSYLLGIGFTRSVADACLFHRHDKDGVVIFPLYVDDIQMQGHKAAVQKAIKELKAKFSITVLDKVEDFNGCHLTYLENGIKLTQPKLIKTLEEYDIPGKTPKVPAQPGLLLTRLAEGQTVMKDKMTDYRSGVGKMLYLVKLTRPDLGNSVRECSKFMDQAGSPHMDALMRLIKYVQSTAHHGLFYTAEQPKTVVNLMAYVDSNYATDTENRKSITGFLIYMNGCLIAWKSKQQGSVTLSVSEAEYIAAAHCAAEMFFLYQVLQTLDMPVILPMVLKTDSDGCKKMSQNWSTQGRTKHIDVRHHFLRELQDKKLLRVKHIPGEENPADLLTKNLGTADFQKHARFIMHDSAG